MVAVLAVMIGILVIHVNFVIFQGLFDAIVQNISDYRNGLIYNVLGENTNKIDIFINNKYVV